MAVIAEPAHCRTGAFDVTDDRLAARNALVLAVAQALAGGNNTVIVATTAIIGSMLAPDPALATLPISVMVAGMWLGTLPVGMLAKAYGRRFALQTGSAVRRRSPGFISCAAVLHGLVCAVARSAPCAAAFTPPRISPTASPPPIPRARNSAPKAVSWVLAGGVFAGVIGPQLVIFTKDIWPAYLFAGELSRAIGLRAARRGRAARSLNIPRPQRVALAARRAAARRDRRAAEIHRRGRLRAGELHDDEHGHDLGAAGDGVVQPLGQRGGARHSMACARHVCAELRHRLADRALWRAADDGDRASR